MKKAGGSQLYLAIMLMRDSLKYPFLTIRPSGKDKSSG